MASRSLHSKDSQETFISLLQLDPTPIDADSDSLVSTEKPLPPLPEETSTSSGSRMGVDGPSTKTQEVEKPQPSSSSSPSTHRGGAPNLILFLTRCQRYSSYTLSIFTSIHLANTSLIPLFTRSVAASEKHLLLAREIYQTPLSEPLLIGIPVLAHIASGLALRLLRRSQNLRKYGGATPGIYALHRSRPADGSAGTASSSSSSSPSVRIWPPLSYISLSGYAFTAFFAAHLAMNRVLPLVVEGDSSNIGLAFIAHGFARHPAVASVAYAGLLGVGCGHMVWGAAKWLGLAQQAQGWGWGWEWGWGAGGSGSGSGSRGGSSAVDKKTRRRRRRVWVSIHAAAAGLALLWSAGGLGVVARGGPTMGWIGDIYDGLYSRVWL